MLIYQINEISKKRVLGRSSLDYKTLNTKAIHKINDIALFWAASALELNVKASDFWVKMSADYDVHPVWVAIEVNGSQVARFPLSNTPQWYCVAAGFNPEKENLISIIKDTQPMGSEKFHSMYIHEVGFEKFGEFCDLPSRSLNIEFIGDSITSGEGLAGSPMEMDWISQWMCASKTYARQTALALNANYSVLSQCGWGLCWGWDGNKRNNLPDYYDKICGILNSSNQVLYGSTVNYDFPIENDFVILNLGTNDNGAFFQPAWKDEKGIEYPLHVDENKKAIPEDGEKIVKGVYDFLLKIREKNSKAKIIWTWGMLKLTAVPDYIIEGINKYKKEKKDDKVFYLEFDAMEDVEINEEDKGSRGHPGPKTHALAANKLITFIKNIN